MIEGPSGHCQPGLHSPVCHRSDITKGRSLSCSPLLLSQIRVTDDLGVQHFCNSLCHRPWSQSSGEGRTEGGKNPAKLSLCQHLLRGFPSRESVCPGLGGHHSPWPGLAGGGCPLRVLCKACQGGPSDHCVGEVSRWPLLQPSLSASSAAALQILQVLQRSSSMFCTFLLTLGCL